MKTSCHIKKVKQGGWVLMTSLKRKETGFTIVELLIVIVVIGILAALVITTFNGIQKKGRDTERQTDIKALHGQVEAYFAQNGNYPTLAQLNDRSDDGFVDTNLKGLDDGAFEDPTGNTEELANSATPDGQYGYVVAPVTCDNEAGGDCESYELVANLEGQIDGQDYYIKESLNN